ncbi:hypothetical protein EBR57_10810, partial [bacterium]|nr:hypothetical protein [bacterium]
GEKKVFKLLTDGTPNHGISDDNRAALEMIFNFDHGSQQAGGEYVEMSARPSFNGKSFTDWLNEGWEKFCIDNHVRYATIAGNKDPYPLIDIGIESDGVIDRASVFLPGAEFNSIIPACHIKNFELPIVPIFSDDESIVHSTFTKETIKRWIFRDEVHIGAAVTEKKMLAVSPFYDKYLLQYEAFPDPVVVRILISDSKANTILDRWIPAYSGPPSAGSHQVIFDSGAWASGVYIGYVEAYDMNGKVYERKNLTAVKVPGVGSISDSPILTFISTPEWYTDSRQASFNITSSHPSTYLAYRMDGGPYSAYSLSNNKIATDNLAIGLHTLYVTGVGSRRDQDPAIFRWMVVKPSIVTLNTRVISSAEAVTG